MISKPKAFERATLQPCNPIEATPEDLMIEPPPHPIFVKITLCHPKLTIF